MQNRILFFNTEQKLTVPHNLTRKKGVFRQMKELRKVQPSGPPLVPAQPHKYHRVSHDEELADGKPACAVSWKYAHATSGLKADLSPSVHSLLANVD